MGGLSHALAGIGISNRQQQPDNAGREQNRIEHFILQGTWRLAAL
jgi:hypothetical protein